MLNQTKTEYTLEELEEIKNIAIKQSLTSKHIWRQRGIYVICTSCENEHAIYLGTSKILIGVRDDGSPNIVDIDKQ